MSTTISRSWLGICWLAALLVAAPCVEADIIEAQASRDATIFELEDNGTHSLGGGAAFFAGKNNGNSKRRGLLAFDLSELPAGSTINSVRLELVLAQAAGGGGGTSRAISLHKLLADWGEGVNGNGAGPGGVGQGELADPGDATWHCQFYDTDLWATAGGDFVATASATTSVGSVVGTKYSWESTAMLADVQGWWADPDSNFGWLLYGDESTTTTFRAFWSREADLLDASRAVWEPKLLIDYTAVPEPSSIVLFAGVTLALCVGRRHRRRAATR